MQIFLLRTTTTLQVSEQLPRSGGSLHDMGGRKAGRQVGLTKVCVRLRSCVREEEEEEKEEEEEEEEKDCSNTTPKVILTVFPPPSLT